MLGIIVPLSKLLSNEDYPITNPRITNGNKEIALLNLTKDREYRVPAFQREIRWNTDNLSQLIDDISKRPQYLGNMIMAKDNTNNSYSIIDGQQRLTVLTMILSCINSLHQNTTATFAPCKLEVESFTGLTELMLSNFSEQSMNKDTILKSDMLFQINRYKELWEDIKNNSIITDQSNAEDFLENFKKCNVNIIVSQADAENDIIQYFIDTNLKGQTLDTEDIFKGYLLKRDASVRDEWYSFKKYAEPIKDNYPLLKLLEHYFYCDLYNNNKFSSLIYKENFELDKPITVGNTAYRKGTHIIEVIKDNQYMKNSLLKLNCCIEVIYEILSSKTSTQKFKELFSGADNKKIIDDLEITVIHSMLYHILRDSNILPKALVMKYILTVFINSESKTKKDYKQAYAVYLLSVLFGIFENKKSKDLLQDVLKAKSDVWYSEMVKRIKNYFSSKNITDSRLSAQYNLQRIDDEDKKFKCKSLATIYNFFTISNDQVMVNDVRKMKQFLTDEINFSIEHFIISQSGKVLVVIDEDEFPFDIPKDAKKYTYGFFNFIFISNELNDKLSNYWLPQKLKITNENINSIVCEYSKMVLSKLGSLSDSMKKYVGKDANNLDNYFKINDGFNDRYSIYAREVLMTVVNKISESFGITK